MARSEPAGARATSRDPRRSSLTHPRLLVMPVLAAITLVAACAPASPSNPASAPGSAPAQPVRKTLALAYVQEPPNVEGFSGEAGRGGSGPVKYMVHDYLVHEDDRPAWEPHLAVEAPSVERGTWQVNPDGSMDI